MPRVVVIIPARGGSQRIPRKNIREFCGKPIIAYPIQLALDSGVCEKVIVSTDDEEIADVARQYGAEVPFLRPAELGCNKVPMLDVMAHAVGALEDDFDYACMMAATSPLLTQQSFVKGWDQASSLPDRELVFSAIPYGHPVHRGFELAEGNSPRMLWPERYRHNSQDLPELYHDACQFYFGTASMWKSRPGNLFETKCQVVVLGRHEVVDIDTEDDWEFAERLYRASSQ